MSKNTTEDVFERAVQLAKKSVMTQKHGAVIVKGGEIIGQGYNHATTFMSHSWSCHAEVAAILNLKNKSRKYLEDATLIVVRVGPVSIGCPMKLSKPCENCRKAIEKVGIRKVFYSA